jgi:hypothetical protein
MGGFVSVDHTPQLLGIQCESCHGNGSEHAANPEIETTGNSRGVCKDCHNADQSPDFVFEKYWEEIRH